jgi:hypothetical protein
MALIPLSVSSHESRDTIKPKITQMMALNTEASSAFELALQDAILKGDMNLMHSFILPTVDFVIKAKGEVNTVKVSDKDALNGLQFVLAHLPACTLTISSAQDGGNIIYILEFDKKDGKAPLVWALYTKYGQIFKIYVG